MALVSINSLFARQASQPAEDIADELTNSDTSDNGAQDTGGAGDGTDAAGTDGSDGDLVENHMDLEDIQEQVMGGLQSFQENFISWESLWQLGAVLTALALGYICSRYPAKRLRAYAENRESRDVLTRLTQSGGCGVSGGHGDDAGVALFVQHNVQRRRVEVSAARAATGAFGDLNAALGAHGAAAPGRAGNIDVSLTVAGRSPRHQRQQIGPAPARHITQAHTAKPDKADAVQQAARAAQPQIGSKLTAQETARPSLPDQRGPARKRCPTGPDTARHAAHLWRQAYHLCNNAGRCRHDHRRTEQEEPE